MLLTTSLMSTPSSPQFKSSLQSMHAKHAFRIPSLTSGYSSMGCIESMMFRSLLFRITLEVWM